jgi:hypothetical protein
MPNLLRKKRIKMYQNGEVVKRGELEFTVINAIKLGPTHGWTLLEEAKFRNPLYVITRMGKGGNKVAVTVTEEVLSGKERWSEIDTPREVKEKK